MAITKIEKWVTESGLECDTLAEAHMWDVICRHSDDLNQFIEELDYLKTHVSSSKSDYMELLLNHKTDILLFLNDYINGPKFTEEQ